MYFLDCGCVDTYMKFSKRRDDFNPVKDVPNAVKTALTTLHAPEKILLMSYQLTDAETAELRADAIQVEPIARFTRGDVVDEHYFLYKVSLVPVPASSTR